MPKISKSTITNNNIQWSNVQGNAGIKVFGANFADENIYIYMNEINASKANKGIWLMDVESPVGFRFIFPFFLYPAKKP